MKKVKPGPNITKQGAEFLNTKMKERGASKGDRVERPSDLIDYARKTFPTAYPKAAEKTFGRPGGKKK